MKAQWIFGGGDEPQMVSAISHGDLMEDEQAQSLPWKTDCSISHQNVISGEVSGADVCTQRIGWHRAPIINLTSRRKLANSTLISNSNFGLFPLTWTYPIDSGQVHSRLWSNVCQKSEKASQKSFLEKGDNFPNRKMLDTSFLKSP